MGNDRRYRVVDDDRLVGAEVVDVGSFAFRMSFGSKKDCRDAVLDVEVGLLLAPIPQDA